MFKTVKDCLEVYKKKLEQLKRRDRKEWEANVRLRPSFPQELEKFYRTGKGDELVRAYFWGSMRITTCIRVALIEVLGLTPKEVQKIDKKIKEKIRKGG